MLTGPDFTNPASIVSRNLTLNADNMPTVIERRSLVNNALISSINLTYDGNGARAKKVAGGTTTYYVSSDYEIKNGVATKYVFAGNLRVASIEGTNNTTKIYHKDHLGSSIAITDSLGVDAETSEYLPFGGMREPTGTAVSGYKYTDQELDSESGLYNYDARLYDPIIGRFISADSEMPEPYDPQSLNRYSYCRNNPLIYVDPTGHYIEMSILFWKIGDTEFYYIHITITIEIYGFALDDPPSYANNVEASIENEFDGHFFYDDGNGNRYNYFVDSEAKVKVRSDYKNNDNPDDDTAHQMRVSWANMREKAEQGGQYGNIGPKSESKAIAHETGHFFGIIDEYDESKKIQTCDSSSIMCSGNSTSTFKGKHYYDVIKTWQEYNNKLIKMKWEGNGYTCKNNHPVRGVGFNESGQGVPMVPVRNQIK